jgi:hypothetical protein
MDVSTRTLRRRVAIALLMALLVPLAGPSAQDVTEVRLKGAFVFNFARFTEWPAGVIESSRTVGACVVGDVAVGRALASTVQGREVQGRTVTVLIDPATAALPGCHLLYVTGADSVAILPALTAVQHTPVLTISDVEGFARAGGMIQLHVEHARLGFRINIDAARCAGLSLSSRLLSLAEVVDGARARAGSVASPGAPGAPACTPETGQP